MHALRRVVGRIGPGKGRAGQVRMHVLPNGSKSRGGSAGRSARGSGSQSAGVSDKARNQARRGEEAEGAQIKSPANAGKRSNFASPTSAFRRDHPRACGEKCEVTSSGAELDGSPPRLRGKVVRGYMQCPMLRITPASAGKRPEMAKRARKHEDHPRVCGEKA